jgi:hypothetical protein
MRPAKHVLVTVTALLAAAAGAGASTASARGDHPSGHPGSDAPDKVVIIVVDALSREIVHKYGMRNVQRLMRDGADSPRGYLGHLGSVTVVTHNVLTTGALPKNMGWTDEGYRDVDGVLAGQGPNDSNLWVTSDLTSDQQFALQEHAGYPKLADYLHARRPGSKVVAISPKAYAAWGLGGAGADRQTAGSTSTPRRRSPTTPTSRRRGSTRSTATGTPSGSTPSTRAVTCGQPTRPSGRCATSPTGAACS